MPQHTFPDPTTKVQLYDSRLTTNDRIAIIIMSRVLIYLLRRDIRLADNPVFHEIARLHSQSHRPFSHLIPLYVFPAEQIEVSGFLSSDAERSPCKDARSSVSGFWRCGRLRAKFIAESVWDLKKDLESIGSGLVIRVGAVQDAVRSILDGFKERSDVEVHGVWMTGEEGWEEQQQEKQVKKLMEQENKEFELFSDEKYYINEYEAASQQRIRGGRIADNATVRTYRSRTSKISPISSHRSERQLSHFAQQFDRHSINQSRCLRFKNKYLTNLNRSKYPIV